MTDEPEKKCPFRAVGFKPAAAEFPRDELALIMLAAFNNVSVDKLSEGMRYFPNESTKTAWTRVADAARAHLTERVQDGESDPL